MAACNFCGRRLAERPPALYECINQRCPLSLQGPRTINENQDLAQQQRNVLVRYLFATTQIATSIDRLRQEGISTEGIVARIAETYIGHAQRALNFPIEYDVFRKIVEGTVVMMFGAEPILRGPGVQPNTEWLKDEDTTKPTTPFALWKRQRRRTAERITQTQQKTLAQQQRKQQIYQLLSRPAPQGMGKIVVQVRNESDKRALGVEVKCSAAAPQNLPPIEPKKSDMALFIVPLGGYYFLSVSSSTHNAEPKEEHVKLGVGKRVTEEKVFKLTLKEERETTEQILKREQKALAVKRQEHFKKLGGTTLLLVLGLALAALLSSPWFFLAMVAFAIHYALPPTDVGEGIAEQMKTIRDRYESLIRAAEKSERSKDVIDSLYKRMEAEMKAQRIIGEFTLKKMFTSHYGREFGRQMLRAIGFLFLATGLILSPIPVVPVIGLIAAFVGYFLVGSGEYYKEEEGEKRA